MHPTRIEWLFLKYIYKRVIIIAVWSYWDIGTLSKVRLIQYSFKEMGRQAEIKDTVVKPNYSNEHSFDKTYFL